MIENVKCPDCDGPMVSRKSGKDGRIFWGCKAFPKCRGTRNTDGEAPRRRTDGDGPDTERALPSDRLRENDRARWRNQ